MDCLWASCTAFRITHCGTCECYEQLLLGLGLFVSLFVCWLFVGKLHCLQELHIKDNPLSHS